MFRRDPFFYILVPDRNVPFTFLSIHCTTLSPTANQQTMISALTSKDLATMKRCSTSILPDNHSDIIQVQGFYWPRRVIAPETIKTNKAKPVKAKRRRKYSFSKERYYIAECLKLLPKSPSDIDLFQSIAGRQEYSSSTPERRQQQHSYAWNPAKREPLKATEGKSRIVPEKGSQRKPVRSTDKRRSPKG